MDSALWSELPDDIVETILRLHFRTLSPSDLVQFRLLSRFWNHVILLSSEVYCHRLHQQTPHALKSVFCMYEDGSFMSLDSKSSNWIRVSLDFLLNHESEAGPKTGQSHTEKQKVLDSLQLLTTDGGLLCFSTCNSGQVIVCNLITKRWKDVWIPPEIIGLGEYSSQARSRHVPRRKKSSRGNMDDFLVGLIVARDEGEFKLAVTRMSDFENADGERLTILYSSVSKTWRKLSAPFPNPLHLQGGAREESAWTVKSLHNAILTYRECVYCLLKYEQPHTIGTVWRLLKFDPKIEGWSVVTLPRSRQHQWTWWQVSLQLLEHRGRLVLLESTSLRWFEFYTIEEDSGSSNPIHWVRILETLSQEISSFVWYFPPCRRASRALATCLRCVGQGKCLYFVQENFDREPRDLRVLVCTTSSEFSAPDSKVQNLELWESDICFNQSRYCMFQPSLTPVA